MQYFQKYLPCVTLLSLIINVFLMYMWAAATFYIVINDSKTEAAHRMAIVNSERITDLNMRTSDTQQQMYFLRELFKRSTADEDASLSESKLSRAIPAAGNARR